MGSLENIAFVWNGNSIYWSSLILALAVLCTVLMAVAFRILQGESVMPVLLLAPAAIVLGLFGGRLVHWYCRYQQYAGLAAALLSFSGGFSLVGVILGCLAAAALIRLVRGCGSLPALLDCLAPAGMLGIAVGRLSGLFTDAMRGKRLILDAAKQRLPFAAETVNPATGGTEWRFAVFSVQSMLALAAFALLAALFIREQRRSERGEKGKRGNVFLAFLALWGAGEIVMDSMRYDALYLRSNGFVSMVQIVGACALTAVLAILSVRSVKAKGLHLGHFAAWGGAVSLLGAAGYMEYFVQRHGDRFVMCYTVMALCLAVLLMILFALYLSIIKNEKAKFLTEKRKTNETKL